MISLFISDLQQHRVRELVIPESFFPPQQPHHLH